MDGNHNWLGSFSRASATIQELLKEIERLKEEVAALRWRIASKEHPAGFEWCLMLSNGPRFSLGWFGGYWVSSDGSPSEPTHWMPLPKPPATEGGE